jgi:glycosyltransferase involved in cell wall biosynthesis
MAEGARSLIVDLSTRFGGASARALGLLQRMRGEAALASLEGSPVTAEARAYGLEVHAVGTHKLDPRVGVRLAAIVRKYGFDVLDAQNPQSKLWASFAAAATDCALVSTLNSWYLSEHGGDLKGRFYHALERLTSRRVDLYIAVSEEIVAQLRATGVPDGWIVRIENAVHLDRDQVTGDPHWLRSEFELPVDAYVACAVGRLVAAKGFEYLIRSIDELRTIHPELHCLIVGEGELRGKLAADISRMNLQRRIRLVGFCPRGKVLRIVKAADLFVMPSLSEGTPLALLEAAALGTPIVASHVGGIPTVLTHQEHALLTEPKSVPSLSAALSRMIQDRRWAAALGRHARERVIERFSLEAQVESTREAYRVALSQATRRLDAERSSPGRGRAESSEARDAQQDVEAC